VRAASGRYDRAVAGAIAAAQRAPVAVLLAALVLAALALALVARDLGVNTSTADMISDRARFMHVYRALKARFPERSDNLVVVVEADTPDRARDAADRRASTAPTAARSWPGTGSSTSTSTSFSTSSIRSPPPRR
jgi:hypothetical protein